MLKELLIESSGVSSGRAINISGAVIGAMLLIFSTVKTGTLDADLFAIYLAYCGGVYGLSKGISAYRGA